MKTSTSLWLALVILPILAALAGCEYPRAGLTNPKQPGPAAGHVVGGAVGLAAGNVAGFAVGSGEGAAAGMAAPFTRPETSTVRDYRIIVGPDGQVTRVPVDVAVDKYGRVVAYPPKHQPPPPPGTNALRTATTDYK